MIKKQYLKNILKASLTVEAAFIMPICIYAFAVFLYLMQCVIVWQEIGGAMTETGKLLSQYAVVYERSSNLKEESIGKDFLEYTILKEGIKKRLDKTLLKNSCIVGGIEGINFGRSKILDNNEEIEIIAVYKLKISLPIFDFMPIAVFQKVKIRGFTGYDGLDNLGNDQENTNEDEDIVYITETGTVYHIKKSCTHLTLDIHKTTYGQSLLKRNTSGGKYKACEQCIKNRKLLDGDIVYITSTGDRYHGILSCSGLKRTIIEINISQVGGKSACRRCRG